MKKLAAIIFIFLIIFLQNIVFSIDCLSITAGYPLSEITIKDYTPGMSISLKEWGPIQYQILHTYPVGVKLNFNRNTNTMILIEFNVLTPADFQNVNFFQWGYYWFTDYTPNFHTYFAIGYSPRTNMTYPGRITMLSGDKNLDQLYDVTWGGGAGSTIRGYIGSLLVQNINYNNKWRIILRPTRFIGSDNQPLSSGWPDWENEWQMDEGNTIFFFNLNKFSITINNIKIYQLLP